MSTPRQAAVIEDAAATQNVLTDFEEALIKQLEELELPTEDGIPLESNWHRIQMNLLIDSVNWHWRDRDDYFTGGNMFIYFSLRQVQNMDFRGPDFFVVKNTDRRRDRDSWVAWEEGGRYPDMIVELSSPSTIHVDLNDKKKVYEKILRVPDYFCYDPAKKQLMGWRNENGYQKLHPNKKGWLRSRELDLWLGAWEGEVQRLNAVWLRFYDNDGRLILTAPEAEAQRAETEARRADAETQRADRAEAEMNRLKEELARLKKEV